jgi:sialic acid synthase SpsE
VVTIAPVRSGDVLSAKNLWVKRPGTGEIRAADYDSLLGRKAVRDVPADTQLRWEDVQQ